MSAAAEVETEMKCPQCHERIVKHEGEYCAECDGAFWEWVREQTKGNEE